MARQMKDSGVEWIGEIPEGWHTIRFKYLHNGMNTGEAIDKEYWTTDDNDRVFYTAGLVPIRTNYASFPDWKYTTERDLLLARNGTPYVYYSQVNACYTDHIIRAIMKDNGNKRFIQYCLQQSIESVVVDTVSIATWSASLWNEQVITWPSELEQRRIADFLDRRCAEIDAVIERTKATIEEYKKLKQAVITEAVTKGVRGPRPMKDSGIEWIGEIPETWEARKLSGLSERIVVGVVIRPSEYFDEQGTVPFIRGLNVKEYRIVENDFVYITEESNQLLDKSIIHTGDVLIVRDGSIGTSCVVPPKFDGANVVSLVIVTTGEELLSDYLCYLLNSDIGKHQFEMTKIGSALTHTSVGSVSKIKCLLPSVTEQQEIIEYLDTKRAALDTLIAKKTDLLTELETYKKSLIYEYVTGKKEVPACP